MKEWKTYLEDTLTYNKGKDGHILLRFQRSEEKRLSDVKNFALVEGNSTDPHGGIR
jgi:hypothetical protein